MSAFENIITRIRNIFEKTQPATDLVCDSVCDHKFDCKCVCNKEYPTFETIIESDQQWPFPWPDINWSKDFSDEHAHCPSKFPHPVDSREYRRNHHHCENHCVHHCHIHGESHGEHSCTMHCGAECDSLCNPSCDHYQQPAVSQTDITVSDPLPLSE